VNGVTSSYVRVVQTRSDPGAFVALGRELYEWLYGAQGQLSTLLDGAIAPVLFEAQGWRAPSDRQWALLRAPLELLARPGERLVANDKLARFSMVRRLGPTEQPSVHNDFRMGVAFRVSERSGTRELNLEAEKAGDPRRSRRYPASI
jgi:hypothetical protein